MRLHLSVFLIATGCRGPETPAWTALHGSLRETELGVDGYLVWELFDRKWGRKHSADRHVCARVQSFQGVADPGLAGCDDCTVWATRSEELDTDCVAPWDSDPALAGPTHIGFGPLPDGYAAVGAHGDAAEGWYLSWDGETLDPQGVAHDEARDLPAAVSASRAGSAWVLTPATAWQVGR